MKEWMQALEISDKKVRKFSVLWKDNLLKYQLASKENEPKKGRKKYNHNASGIDMLFQKMFPPIDNINYN